MSKTYRNRPAAQWSRTRSDEFRCRHCRIYVGVLPSGGHHRNHCPFCLYSRHVDDVRPGDRASDCGGSMEPVGAYTRPKGEHVLVHRCFGCGTERHCRIGADDDFRLVMSLPVVQPRVSKRAAPLERTA